MSLISKILNFKQKKIIYLNSPEFLLNLENNKKNREKNTKISHKNIKNVTQCLNCIAADPKMADLNKYLLSEQADHFNSLKFYCYDKCFAENLLFIESATKLFAAYVSDPERSKLDYLRSLTVQWLEFFEQYLILMTEYYCLNKYNAEIKWENDGSFYLKPGLDRHNIIDLVFEIIGGINDFVVEIEDMNNDLGNMFDLIKTFNVSNIVSNIIFDDANRKRNYTVTEINNEN